MSLSPGTTLLNYRLVEKVGEGGMGEVWKATDATLGRDVAIKFLPIALSADSERRVRFEHEARVLAALNHPNIAAIYGLHEAEGLHFLAMEFVPGEDLAQRIAHGAIPLAETIDVARQVAEALEAAHDKGIVHRDLKPANVKLTPDGRVKVLDFGLAKALDPVASGNSGMLDSRLSPTITSLGSVAGVVLGTAAYMSPEQAKGKSLDRRTDIWAFGCLVYEMLTGRRPFEGEGISEVLAAVIMAPIPFDALPPTVPPRLQLLVRRCLERDPRRRLRDIGEARVALEEMQAGTVDDAPVSAAAAAPVAAPKRTSPLAWAAALVATAAVAALATVAVQRATAPGKPPAPLRRFEIPAQGPFRSVDQSRLVAISPDGTAIAYVEAGKLLVRPLARIEPIAIALPADPAVLFWSPDSAFIGFIAAGRIWKVPAGGGESTIIADVRLQLTGGASAAWCPDGKIVFTSGDSGVLRVSSSGGESEEIVPLEAEREQDMHDAACLPDNSVLFVPHRREGRPNSLWIFTDGKRKQLLEVAADQDIWFPTYSPAGFILYERRPLNAGVWAVPFSLARREVTGEPFLVAAGADVPSVSNDGTLVRVSGTASRTTRMAAYDREGRRIQEIGPPQDQWPFPELSPDGRFVAISAKENELTDVWIHDVERGTRTRMSASRAGVSFEAWSSDGGTLFYTEGTAPPLHLMSKNADGSGEARAVATGFTPALSADGRYLLFTDIGRETDSDVWYLDRQSGGAAVPLLQSKAGELAPRLAPNGRYFAYVSNESGPDEVYLKRFPAGEGRWQVSTAGGAWPRFSRKGDKLYYVVGESIMEVDVDLGAEPKLGAPHELFKRRPLGWPLIFGWPPGFDVSADGSRFILVEPAGETQDHSGIVVEENWYREFAK